MSLLLSYSSIFLKYILFHVYLNSKLHVAICLHCLEIEIVSRQYILQHDLSEIYSSFNFIFLNSYNIINILLNRCGDKLHPCRTLWYRITNSIFWSRKKNFDYKISVHSFIIFLVIYMIQLSLKSFQKYSALWLTHYFNAFKKIVTPFLYVIIHFRELLASLMWKWMNNWGGRE